MRAEQLYGLRVSDERGAVPLQGRTEDALQLLDVGRRHVPLPRNAPARLERVPCEARLVRLVPVKPQEPEDVRHLSSWILNEVFHADIDPLVAGHRLAGPLQRFDEDLPPEAGEHDEGAPRVLPRRSVRRAEWAQVPVVRPLVTVPPPHLEPRTRNRSTVTDDVDVACLGIRRGQEPGAWPARKVMHENGLALRNHPGVEEVRDATLQPWHRVVSGQVAARARKDRRDLLLENFPPFRWRDAQASPLDGSPAVAKRAQRGIALVGAVEQGVVPAPLEVEATELVVEVGHETNVVMASDQLGHQG